MHTSHIAKPAAASSIGSLKKSSLATELPILLIEESQNSVVLQLFRETRRAIVAIILKYSSEMTVVVDIVSPHKHRNP